MTDISSTSSSTSSATKAKTPTAAEAASLAAAKKMMTIFMTSNSVEQSLADQSALYWPPNDNKIVATVWALFDSDANNKVRQDDIKQLVFDAKGKLSDLKALWEQLNPDKKPYITAKDFVTNKFMADMSQENLEQIQEDVRQLHLMDTGISGTVLSKFASGSMLTRFIEGGSPVGGPDSDYRRINIFT